MLKDQPRGVVRPERWPRVESRREVFDEKWPAIVHLTLLKVGQSEELMVCRVDPRAVVRRAEVRPGGAIRMAADTYSPSLNCTKIARRTVRTWTSNPRSFSARSEGSMGGAVTPPSAAVASPSSARVAA